MRAIKAPAGRLTARFSRESKSGRYADHEGSPENRFAVNFGTISPHGKKRQNEHTHPLLPSSGTTIPAARFRGRSRFRLCPAPVNDYLLRPIPVDKKYNNYKI